jgi:hypothetical protein
VKQKRCYDPRGQVAVVTASADGPAVYFIDSSRYERTWALALTSSLRTVASVFARREGDEVSFPVAIWVQPRAEQWEPA